MRKGSRKGRVGGSLQGSIQMLFVIFRAYFGAPVSHEPSMSTIEFRFGHRDSRDYWYLENRVVSIKLWTSWLAVGKRGFHLRQSSYFITTMTPRSHARVRHTRGVLVNENRRKSSPRAPNTDHTVISLLMKSSPSSPKKHHRNKSSADRRLWGVVNR